MITANWSAAAAIFDAVVDLDDHERDAYLSAACANKPDLRHDVEAMLAADSEASGIFSNPILGRPLVLGGELSPLDRLGPYEIVRLIGRGGMGAVYLANRVEDFERLVAIKIIDCLVPDKAVFRRFLRERQILSTLDHPNIARLFGGSVTDTGLPYLVMEYVDGQPIDEYCRSNALSIEQRLELFADVCEAVSYAHRRLIVHRDIKPGNILVSRDGQVKLVDFGIAKQMVEDPRASTITGHHHVLATPKYASPEQMAGAQLSTSWDVYSLGKVLDLLLTEPNATSLIGGSTAVPWHVHRRMQRIEMLLDVESIVSNSTSEHDSDRYDSAGDLSGDIERVLRGAPPNSRRLSGPSLMLSVCRRHLKGVALIVLIVAIVFTLSAAFVNANEAAASRELIAQGLSSYLVSLFHVTDPDGRSRSTISAIEVLDQGTVQARANLPHDSPEYIRIIREIGSLYIKIGAYREAQNLLTEVLASSVIPDPQFVASVHLDIGRLFYLQGSNDDASLNLETSLRLLSPPRLSTADLYSQVIEEMVLVAVSQNRLVRADSLADACLSFRVQWFGRNSPRAVSAHGLKARVRWRARDYRQAEKLYRKALDAERRSMGPRSLAVAYTLNDLGLVYVEMTDYERGEILLRQSLSIKKSVLGEDHPSYATSLSNMALAISKRFGPDSAVSVMRTVVPIFIGNFGIKHHEVATAKNNLALYLEDAGRLDDAEILYREALSIWRSVVGRTHPDYILGCQNMAIFLRRRGEYQEATEFYGEAVQGLRVLGENYRETLAGALNGLGKALGSTGDLVGAAASFRESLAIREQELPPGHWRIGTARSLLGEALGHLGNHDEAESYLRSGIDILRDARGEDDPKTQEAKGRLEDYQSQMLAHAS